jgi:hypothetical protein
MSWRQSLQVGTRSTHRNSSPEGRKARQWPEAQSESSSQSVPGTPSAMHRPSSQWAASMQNVSSSSAPESQRVAQELTGRSGGRPLFLFLHHWDVHHDYIPPKEDLAQVHARRAAQQINDNQTGHPYSHHQRQRPPSLWGRRASFKAPSLTGRGASRRESSPRAWTKSRAPCFCGARQLSRDGHRSSPKKKRWSSFVPWATCGR